MPLTGIEAGAASGGVVYALIRIAEKIPWGRLIGRPSKNGKPGIGQETVRVIVSEEISEHQKTCPVNRTLYEMKVDIREIREAVTKILLNGRG